MIQPTVLNASNRTIKELKPTLMPHGILMRSCYQSNHKGIETDFRFLRNGIAKVFQSNHKGIETD